MQVIEIQSPFGADHPELRCPVCGTQLQNNEEYVEQPACSHVTYAFCHTAMAFDYLRSDLEAQLEQRREEEREDDDEKSDLELVREFLADDTLVTEFELTSGGMACGPCWYTNSIAVSWHPAQV